MGTALAAAVVLVGLGGWAVAQETAAGVDSVTGFVVDEDGPVAGATVRLHTTDHFTVTGEDGAFALADLGGAEVVTITAWAEGYYISWDNGTPGGDPVTIPLVAHYLTDNHEYGWAEGPHGEGSASCGDCHPSYAEWRADAHSQTATNPRFISLYSGTDVHGNKSPFPEKTSLGIPLPPDLDEAYYGPGFKLDYPNRAGNCAACHTPVAAKMPNANNCGWSGCHSDITSQNSVQVLDPGVSPLDLKTDAAEGISCEFCHKVGDVYIKRETGLPYEDLPGILSMRLFRPEEGEEIFFGTLDDVVLVDTKVARDTYLPLMKESEFCAGCHHGVMGGVVGKTQVTGGVLIYSSFSEWLASPYSHPESGKTCQDCHMPRVTDYDYVVYPDTGGVRRDQSQISNHTMPGVTDPELMQNAVTMSATAEITGTRMLVEVSLTNDQTGHHVPTDSPLRHLILVVRAKDADGNLIAQRAGPVLPEYAGAEAGLPGKIFAKLLRDEWTGEMPTAAYWRPIAVVKDNRLAAFATDISRYVFPALPDEDVTVEIELRYRRGYQQLMDWKGWTDPDMVMETATLAVPAVP
jgi:hypothetical protein